MQHGKSSNYRNRYGRVLLCLGIVGILATAALAVPGCVLDPEAKNEIVRLGNLVRQAESNLTNSLSSLDTLRAKLSPLQEKIAAAWDKLKNKELPAAEVAAIVRKLSAEKESLLAEIGKLEREAVEAKATIKAAGASMTKLRQEFNVPWYVIAGTVVGSLLTGATGTGLVAKVGNKRLRSALTVAQEGLKIVTGAIQTAKPDTNGLSPEEAASVARAHEEQRKAIKRQVKGTQNPEVEAAVAEAKKAVAMDTVSRAA